MKTISGSSSTMSTRPRDCRGSDRFTLTCCRNAAMRRPRLNATSWRRRTTGKELLNNQDRPRLCRVVEHEPESASIDIREKIGDAPPGIREEARGEAQHQ